MPLRISDQQFCRSHRDADPIPPLLLEPHLMMQHRTFPAGFEFKHLVLDVFELKNTGKLDESYPLLPSGCMILVFEMSSHASRCYLCGAQTTMRKLRVPGESVVFCVRLCPGSADWLVGKRAAHLTDHTALLAQYLPAAEYWLAGLRQCVTFQERVDQFCGYLSYAGAQVYQPIALLQRCISLIHEHHGLLRVSGLADTVGCSVRYISHVFQDRVGISAKTYSEITQLQHSLYGILTTQPKSLLNIAVSYGYFDQAHMNRFYRKFLNYTASDMRYVDCRTIYADYVDDVPDVL